MVYQYFISDQLNKSIVKRIANSKFRNVYYLLNFEITIKVLKYPIVNFKVIIFIYFDNWLFLLLKS